MTMIRRGSIFAMISAVGLIGFACGKSGSDPTVPETRPDQTKSVDEVADGSTNSITSEPFSLALRDWSGQVGEFAKTKARANRVQTVKMQDGTTFVGEIDGEQTDEWGVVTQPTGTRQEGEWRRGEAYRVSGVYVTSDGTREEGTWNEAGMTSGGTIIWKDGRTYKGEWKVVNGSADLLDGMGTMTWPDGRTYTGHFLDGKMDGSGKMTHPDGKIEVGTWMQDRFVVAGKP